MGSWTDHVGSGVIALVGIITGLVGVGGGFLIVPALVLLDGDRHVQDAVVGASGRSLTRLLDQAAGVN